MRSGNVVWCRVCGAYAETHGVGMARHCPGPIAGDGWSGGRAQQLRALLRGRHPKHGQQLPQPVPEELWAQQGRLKRLAVESGLPGPRGDEAVLAQTKVGRMRLRLRAKRPRVCDPATSEASPEGEGSSASILAPETRSDCAPASPPRVRPSDADRVGTLIMAIREGYASDMRTRTEDGCRPQTATARSCTDGLSLEGRHTAAVKPRELQLAAALKRPGPVQPIGSSGKRARRSPSPAMPKCSAESCTRIGAGRDDGSERRDAGATSPIRSRNVQVRSLQERGGDCTSGDEHRTGATLHPDRAFQDRRRA